MRRVRSRRSRHEASGYHPMPDAISPKILKGALVQLAEGFIGPVPNIIVFQYNPESLSRTLTPYNPPTDQASDAQKAGSGDTSQPFDPGETFNLALELDATDALEQPDSHPVAVVSGVADRIAALESLLYPTGDKGSLVTGAIASLAGALGTGGGAGAAAPRPQVAIVLFVWGPGRIVPVRLTSFAVEEQAFSPTLYPVRAKVTLGMQLLGPTFFDQRRNASTAKTLSVAESLAETAYKYTRAQKDLLARANLANSVESVLGMLPF